MLVGACLLLSVAMGFVAWQWTATRSAVIACYPTSPDAPISASCRSLLDWGQAVGAFGSMLIGAATVAPFGLGLFLGAPLISREIEKRTAPIAWSLSPSRRRWLAGRVFPLVVVIGGVLLILAQASDVMQAAIYPDGRGFADFGSRGPLVAARGLAVFGIGVVVGLIVGRVLPAVLVTGLVTAALFIGVQLVSDQLMRAEAVWMPQGGGNSGQFAVIYDTGFRSDATGEVITDQEAYERFPEVFEATEGPPGSPPGMTNVWRVLPPERYPLWVARESGFFVVVALVAGLLATRLVISRRPD